MPVPIVIKTHNEVLGKPGQMMPGGYVKSHKSKTFGSRSVLTYLPRLTDFIQPKNDQSYCK